MLIDITLPVTKQMLKKDPGSQQATLLGHTGTHFDVMHKDFPLEYTCRKGIVFEVSGVGERDIEIGDIAVEKIEPDMFVAFHTGYIEKIGYGEPGYFGNHPQLSETLIDLLLDKGVSIIAVDCAGIRRGSEHVPKDRYCAERGTFVVENLCSLGEVLEHGGKFTAHTYPMRWEGVTGQPCRVIAETEE